MGSQLLKHFSGTGFVQGNIYEHVFAPMQGVDEYDSCIDHLYIFQGCLYNSVFLLTIIVSIRLEIDAQAASKNRQGVARPENFLSNQRPVVPGRSSVT